MFMFKLFGFFTAFGFFSGCIANSLFIFITIKYIKNISVPYKRMIVVFAALGLMFSGFEAISKPFTHNYNGTLLYFSATNFQLPINISNAFITVWSCFYLTTFSFISVLFIYRYLCLFDSSKTRFFEGFKGGLWMLYPLLPGICYASTIKYLCAPNDYTDEYVRDSVAENYGLNVSELARFSLTPYNSDGSVIHTSIIFLLIASSLINFHFSIIIFCSLKMHFNMKKELEKFSVQNQNLQRQYFIALVIQALVPTMFLITPAVPILIAPFLAPIVGIEVDWQSGNLYSLVGFYPPCDCISVALVVSEYRNIIKNKISMCCKNNAQVSVINSL
ncbi:Seven TM Receptor [Caenorhabditis elegans]|uniref:Seven TM Receptor n=1 Tax=Caenorhabditis elegans TaxID=6239 RepID=Q9TXW2_CAEEL|nr:Seven TM Receptor [Caenorhabditis elegans]CCD67819.1 Seven TM Receptor [Caenorhabditis elegans]|eukprot:NP_503849.1 Seven TM Receptor [Caenorhabditis elegans]